MKAINVYGLIFVTLVFISAAIGKIDRAKPETRVLEEEVRLTSLPEVFPLASLNFTGKVFENSAIEVGASVVLAGDLGGEQDFFIKNAERQWPLASLTKLMTAVIVKEKFYPEKNIVIDEAAVSSEGVAGNFQSGEIFKANDLLKAMLTVSSNDAAVALANFYGEKEFINAMQKKALDLGMKRTSFFDVTGLSSLNQSTVSDLRILVNYIFSQYPEIFEMTRKREVEILDLRSKIKRLLVNINQFAGRNDFLGGKTGFTDEANGNLISLFAAPDKGAQPILIIVFGSDDRFGETDKIYNWIKSKSLN